MSAQRQKPCSDVSEKEGRDNMGLLPTKPTEPSKNLEDFIIYLYGREGIGKSTFCSQFPSPIFAITEPGLKSLTRYETAIPNWETFLKFGAEIELGKHPFKTIVIDVVDNLYKYCMEFICKKHGMLWPSDKDFGQGWALVRDEFLKVINRLSLLNYGVIFVSHVDLSEIKTRTSTHSFASPTCPKQADETLRKLADYILYMDTVQTEQGEMRVLHTKPSPFWIGKDKTKRHIPDTIELPIEQEDKMFETFNSAFMGTKK